MQEPVFIGAGTRGAKLVGNKFQPYMIFHGKTCLEYVVEAAMEAGNVGEIYIWGDKKTLERLLTEHIKEYQHGIVIVQEKENIVESFFFAYLQYISRKSNTLRSMVTNWNSIKNVNWIRLEKYFKKTDHWEEHVNVIVSDTPLISSYELDYLIENKNRNADIAIGRTTRKDYKKILKILDETPDKKKSIKNFYTYRKDNKDISLIVNSFIAGKPLKLNENVWNLAGNFYENRTIIAGRKKNLRKIATNILFFKRLFFPKNFGIERYSYTDRVKAIFYLINAYKAIVRSKSEKIHYRDLNKIYESLFTLGNLHIEYYLSHCFGAAFDIDTEYEADFIRKNFFKLQKILREYYKANKNPHL